MKSTRPGSSALPIIGACLGGIVFLLIYGYRVLDPSFTAWTMEGDAGQHLLGWLFFRSEPWTFPPGVIQTYQYPIGTSLVYTDSLPLLAIPLKLLEPILPDVFQYHGLWLLSAYVLQGFFAVLLLRQVTKTPLLILLGSLFFLLSPVMVQRSRVHESLTAHWIILAALYLYFRPDGRKGRLMWLALLILAALVHFYLLFMALVIFAAWALRQLWRNQWTITPSFFLFLAITPAAVAAVMWLAGYFVIDMGSAGSVRFGEHSMNLLSPISASPMKGAVGDFVFLNPLPTAIDSQLFEGFNYLGFGLILMLLLAGVEFGRRRHLFSGREHWPLVLAGLFLLAIALSTKLTFGDRVLFELDLPGRVKIGLGMIRASGRMFWPVSYMLMLAAVGLVVKSHPPKRAAALLLVFVGFQAVDFAPWYLNINYDDELWQSPLKSPAWDEIMAATDHVVFIPPPIDYDPAVIPFSFLAVAHGNTINAASTARTDLGAAAAYAAPLLQDFQDGELDIKTLYVIRDDAYLIPPAAASEFVWGTLDGFSIIGPKTGAIEIEPWPEQR